MWVNCELRPDYSLLLTCFEVAHLYNSSSTSLTHLTTRIKYLIARIVCQLAVVRSFSSVMSAAPNQMQQQQPLASKRRRSLRPIAFCAVAFSTVSVIACVVTLPLVYNHVQSVQSFMQNEVDFCKVCYRCFILLFQSFFIDSIA